MNLQTDSKGCLACRRPGKNSGCVVIKTSPSGFIKAKCQVLLVVPLMAPTVSDASSKYSALSWFCVIMMLGQYFENPSATSAVVIFDFGERKMRFGTFWASRTVAVR